MCEEDVEESGSGLSARENQINKAPFLRTGIKMLT